MNNSELINYKLYKLWNKFLIYNYNYNFMLKKKNYLINI